MKKAYNSKGKYFFFLGLLSICLLFFNSACGLDELDAILDDPFSTDHIPNIDSYEDGRFFSFSTKKLDNANEFGKGYVYYKIYNSSSKMDSEVNTIASMINDSARKYNSATSLIDNYGYKELCLAPSYAGISRANTFSLENKDQTVRIRLTNQVDSTDDHSARIKVDDVIKGIPVRANINKTFDFGRTENSYEGLPLKDDDDTKGFSETQPDSDTNNYYVVLYGVFYMLSATFEKTIYSPVHCLGKVKIDSTSTAN